MKKILFSLSFILIVIMCSAQITLTQSNMPVIGDTARYQYIDTSGFTPGSGGSAAVWDFSTFLDSAQSFHMEYLNPANTPFSSVFTMPGTIARHDGSDYYFFTTDANNHTLIGEANQFTQNEAISYYDPRIIFNFPFTSGSSVNDVLSGNYLFSGYTSFRTGTSSTMGSGTGTLTLPSDSVFQNVLRVKKTYYYRDSTNILGMDVINTFDITSYEWYHSSHSMPLMVYWHHDISLAGNPVSDYWAYYMKFPQNTTKIKETVSSKFLQIFPNPARDNITIEGLRPETNQYDIHILNMHGQIMQIISKSEKRISVSNLETGIYFLKIITPEHIITQKFIKK